MAKQQQGRRQEQPSNGTRDVDYDLISATYHALQGMETCAVYAQDAEEEGEQEVAQFFRDIQQEYVSQADRAKAFLTRRMGRAA